MQESGKVWEGGKEIYFLRSILQCEYNSDQRIGKGVKKCSDGTVLEWD